MVATPRDDKADVFIHRLTLSNLLSFGPRKTNVQLGPLNVLIGPNGSGKSNLIAAIELLRAAPRDLVVPIREGGGISEWLHKSTSRARKGSVETAVDFPLPSGPLRYHLTVEEHLHRFHVHNEFIEDDVPEAGQGKPYRYFGYLRGTAIVKGKAGANQRFARTDLDPSQSILSQRKDPHSFPEITYLGQQFDMIRVYREWSFGRRAPARQPQSSDLPNDFLTEDTSNLALVLNRLRRTPAVKKHLLEMARRLYEGLTDFDVIVEGGTVQVFLEENGITVPAARLSDGTLRYLCLLAILCHDDPPPLVCIEEPELGLHPDIMPTLAGLLREASTRCQLIVTTHSDVLVDALTEEPESVVVCEKDAGQTRLRRLNKEDLAQWLARYSLGELWMKGELGGSRW